MPKMCYGSKLQQTPPSTKNNLSSGPTCALSQLNQCQEAKEGPLHIASYTNTIFGSLEHTE